jgi:hypothetical protein
MKCFIYAFVFPELADTSAVYLIEDSGETHSGLKQAMSDDGIIQIHVAIS